MTPTELVLKQVRLPPHIKALRPYQVEDINELAIKPSCGLYLDLGLGKTLISTFIGCYKIITGQFKKVVVICPETLITQWCQTLSDLGLDHMEYRGSPSQRASMEFNDDFIVLSYQIYQKDIERFEGLSAFYIVDEATILCNPRNLFFKMFNGGVVEKTEYTVLGSTGIKKPKRVLVQYEKNNKGCCLLCGIPVVKPEDYYGLIKSICPDIYDSLSMFERIHIGSLDRFNKADSYRNLDILLENARTNTSSRLLSDHIELPPLITKVVKYELQPDHMKLYRRLLSEKYLATEDGVINALNASALYNWAQRIVLCPEKADYPKETAGFELLDTLLQSQKHFLIFSKYIDTNRKIMQRYKIGAIYGEINSKQRRDEYLSKFKSGELDGLTVHPKSGGYGLDLPQAKFVNFMELPVTPRDYFQCVARAYRPGQTDRVVVTIPYAAGTIQESLYRRIQDVCDDMGQITRLPRSLSEDFNKEVHTKESIFKELRGEI